MMTFILLGTLAAMLLSVSRFSETAQEPIVTFRDGIDLDDAGGSDTEETEPTNEAEQEDEQPADSAVEDSGASETDTGDADNPPEISEDLRKRSRGIFSDDDLRAFADTPEKLDAAVDAVFRRLLATGGQPKRQTTEERKPAETKAEPVAFKVEIDPSEYDESPAKATAKALQSVVEHVSARQAELVQSVDKLTKAYSEGSSASQDQGRQTLLREAERVRKELGTEFNELFGYGKIADLMRNPDSEEYRNADTIFSMMQRVGEAIGRGPQDWDADFAKQVMRSSGMQKFVAAVNRETRRNLAKKVNGTAAGATPRAERREKTKAPKSWDEERAALVRDAQKKIGY